MIQGSEKIKLLAFDDDGTLTSGQLIFGKNGEAYKTFHVRDGMAMRLAHEAGLFMAIVTGRSSDIVKRRSEELHVDVLLMGIKNKMEALDDIRYRYGLLWEEVAYMGDDLNDLSLFSYVGVSACPADACKEVIGKAKFVSSYNGGYGAVREFIEEIMKAQKLWDKAVESFKMT